jgi:hypothetical protein
MALSHIPPLRLFMNSLKKFFKKEITIRVWDKTKLIGPVSKHIDHKTTEFFTPDLIFLSHGLNASSITENLPAKARWTIPVRNRFQRKEQSSNDKIQMSNEIQNPNVLKKVNGD